jgi:MerR family transcriptional regulator, thiopeptide resistance regulator
VRATASNDEDDARGLYAVLALRSLGLPLERIREVLEEGTELRPLIERQLAAVDAAIEAQRRLRERLVSPLEAPTTKALMATIEEMTMIEKHYTPDQLETLARRREQLGPEAIADAEREWAELYAEVERDREAGTDPADPRVQALAARAEALVERFTGGDPAIQASLERLYAEEGPQRASRGMVEPEAFDYLARARRAR